MIRIALAIVAGVVLAAATVAASKGIPGYCGQQYPRLFAASLCGHLGSIGGPVVGRSNGVTVRGSNRIMQTGGVTNPTWTELSTNEAGSWTHTDGYDYVVIEGVRIELASNNCYSFENANVYGPNAVNSTYASGADPAGPCGQVATVTYNVDGTAYISEFSSPGPGSVTGDWMISCAYLWMDSGTLPVTLIVRLGTAPSQKVNTPVTITTTPTVYCSRMQDDGTATVDWANVRISEPGSGQDSSGVEFNVGYVSLQKSSIATTPIKNHFAASDVGKKTQREADVLPFSTADLSVERGEGQVDVAWLDYAYDWPTTPAMHTVVSLAKPGEVRDESGNSLTGTITGPTYDGDGMLFDADIERIDLANVAALGDTGTLVAWVYPTAAATGYLYIGRTSGATAVRHPMLSWQTDKIRFAVADGSSAISLDSDNGLALNKWYLVVGTWDGGADDMDLYVYEEGVGLDSANTKAIGFTPVANAAADAIGYYQSGSQAFVGTMAKLAGYSDVKDSAWVAAEFTRGRTAPFCQTGNLAVCFDMVPTDCRVYYDRPDGSTNRFAYTCGGPTVSQTTTFARGDVTRLTWTRSAGLPIELCVDGTCTNSTLDYVAPSTFDVNGCWGCDDPDGTPATFLDGGLREARLR